MKITIIQPRYFNIWEALGAAYIGAYIKKKFPGKLKISFYQGFFDDDRTIIEGSQKSDIVAFSCTSPAYLHGLNLAKSIKEINPEVRTVFGGFHPSAVPNDCVEDAAVDQVVVGEGEDAFLKIVSGETSSIVYGDKFAGLNDILPDRELIKNIRSIDLCEQQISRRITSFQSVRVCPFSCAFCAERTVTGLFNQKTNPVRERDPIHLLDEIEAVSQKYILDYFKFSDATWNTSKEKVISFCEEKIKRGFILPWEANLHASFVDREMLKTMKAAGCSQINIGCESGSQKILNTIRKGLTVEKIKQVFLWGKELGIERRGYFLIGMPDETVEDIKLTEALIEEIKPDVVGFTLLCPYPGTDFYNPDEMKDYDWSLTDEYSNPFWQTDHFTNKELKEQQKCLTEKYPENLAWHHKIIN